MLESLTPLVNAAHEVILLVATVSIAIFTGLTWVVYGKLRDLTATNNRILEETNRISEQAVVETRLNREAAFRPVVVLTPGSRGKVELKVTKVEWTAKNAGSGTAFELTLTGGPGDFTPPKGEVFLAALEPGEMGSLCEQRPSPGSRGWPSIPFLRVRYRDVFGNRFDSIWQGGTLQVEPAGPEDE